MKRLYSFILAAACLAGLYLALTNNVEWRNLVVAALVGTLVAALLRPGDLRFGRRSPLRAALTLAWYVPWLLWDVLKCGVNVALIVVRPVLRIDPGIIAFKTGSDSQAVRAFSGHGITITPGEMVVAVGRDGSLYTHCLESSKSAANGQAAQDHRRTLIERMVDLDA